MLLTYIDEVGSKTEYVSRGHKKHNTSPAFGYAGFVIPEGSAREFGSFFVRMRNRLYREEYLKSNDPGRFEVKGSQVFRDRTPEMYPGNISTFIKLVSKLDALGGKLFYYAEEKPRGTFSQINSGLGYKYDQRDEGGLHQWMDDVHNSVMRQVLNRMARYANENDENIMVMMDQINENERKPYMSAAYSHIFSRRSEYPEMDKIVEPPMHIDSSISSNIQFADWVAAFLSKFIFYQLDDGWKHYISKDHMNELLSIKIFTFDSKMHFYGYTDDIHNSRILYKFRPKFPQVHNSSISMSPESWERIQKVARRSGL